MVGEAGEEAEVTTNKRGVVAAAIEEVGVVKTARNIIAELRTSENEGKKNNNEIKYCGLTKVSIRAHKKDWKFLFNF